MKVKVKIIILSELKDTKERNDFNFSNHADICCILNNIVVNGTSYQEDSKSIRNLISIEW